MKKKILVIISVILIAFNFVACGAKQEKGNDSDSSNNSQKEDSNKQNEAENDSKPSEGDKDKTTPEAEVPVEGEKNNVSQNEKGTKERDCRVFYYDFSNEEMVYINKKVKVIDGALVTALTNELKDNSANSGFITLDPETAVTSAKLDKENSILKVYFNETFNKSMNLGTAAQCELINSIVYTYGYNYDVDQVAIYVNGEPFIDQRGEATNGNYTVDTLAVKEFVK